ncbi:MAG: hypothetical protein V1809_06240 [Planctomycetota bacterium]
MNAQELTLNIAVNLGRLARWAMEGNRARIEPFLVETADYIRQLESAPRQPGFEKTFRVFSVEFERLKNNLTLDEIWAEDVLTWANILTHRAKLA